MGGSSKQTANSSRHETNGISKLDTNGPIMNTKSVSMHNVAEESDDDEDEDENDETHQNPENNANQQKVELFT